MRKQRGGMWFFLTETKHETNMKQTKMAWEAKGKHWGVFWRDVILWHLCSSY